MTLDQLYQAVCKQPGRHLSPSADGRIRQGTTSRLRPLTLTCKCRLWGVARAVIAITCRCDRGHLEDRFGCGGESRPDRATRNLTEKRDVGQIELPATANYPTGFYTRRTKNAPEQEVPPGHWSSDCSYVRKNSRVILVHCSSGMV